MRSSEHQLRRRAAGICLIAGPGLILAGWSMFPSISDDQEAWVADVAAASTRSAAGLALIIVGVALSVVAYMGLVHLLREHRPIAGDFGGAIAIVGTVLMGAMAGLALAEVEVIRHLGASADTAAIIDDIDGSAAASVVWAGPVFATIGLLVLATGLARAQTTPPLMAGLLAAGTLVHAVGWVLTSVAVIVVGSALMFVALAYIGAQMLLETDEEWEHVPQFHGFHRTPRAVPSA